MEKLMFKSVAIVACAMLLIACKKNEQPIRQSEVATMALKNDTNYRPLPFGYYLQYFRALDTVCPPYLQFTNKIDISALPPGDYKELSDGALTINISGGSGHLTKLKASTTEWWSNWNVRPYVESDNPEILCPGNVQGIRLLLSKKCYVLGFELGALLNEYDGTPLQFWAFYYNDALINQPIVGSVRRFIPFPGGANLIAVKSDIPFNEVRISYGGLGGIPRAYAITNIRYITDKQVYNAHKED
jgi:hypothetical protein